MEETKMGKAPIIKYNGEKFQEGKLGKAILSKLD